MGATAVNPAAPPRRGLVPARLLKVASDEKLVALVRQGNQAAFEVVFDRHHRGILSFCRHMLGSREEAEDAVQHTFMAAYKHLVGSDGDMQLRAWLYTIARNRCLSVLRARREQPSDDIELVSVEGLATEVQRRDDLRELLQDMADLPEDQRAALVLSEIGDLGHDDIARVLEVPKDKVKALVFQARSSLHQSREARETSCDDIREMLATLSGGSLRRSTLRRHIKGCAGCQAFEAEVKRQRRAMAVVLPVAPTLALKESALAAAFGQGAAAAGTAAAGGAAAAAGGGILSGGGASALAAKVLVVATVAGGGAAGVSAVGGGGGEPAAPRSTPATGSAPQGSAPAPAVTAEAGAEQEAKVEEEKPRKSKRGRRRGQTERGKEFAKTRGKGEKRGLNGTQPGKAVSEEKKAKRQQGKARRKVAEQKAKAKGKAKAKAQKPAKQKPARTPQPKREATPRPTAEPKPEATPRPTPEARPEATPTPGPRGPDAPQP